MDSPFYGRIPSRIRPRSHHGACVREIPVQFFGSEEKRPSRSDSAVKIQKAFRGFLVRKILKTIAEIRSQVEEIEKRISEEETMDLIAKDSKERLRINEMLMSLLFRLDSIRGVDSGVRDCRKSVIKKAIALQELVDAVVSSNNNNKNDQNSEKVAEAVDDENPAEQVEITEDGEKEGIENQNGVGEAEEVVEDFDVMPSVSGGPEESVGTSQSESQADSSANPEASEVKQENNAIGSGEAEEVEGKTEESTKNRELLERMMKDNERMMDMMAQLFERNEMQTRLLSSLSQRVEQLERAFVCERLRRKKKRNAAGSVDGGCEMSPDNKKCGKR